MAARIETRPEPGEVMKTLVSELEAAGAALLLATPSPGDAALTVRYSSALLEPDSLSPTAVHLLTSHRLLPHNFAIYEELIDRHQVVFLTDIEPLLRHAMKELPVEIVDEILTHALITATTGVAVLPLIVEDQALGLLALWGESMHQEDIPAATLFTSQVAIALQNAHLYTEVQQLAVTDELTGLYNRRGLYSLGRREAERALRFQRPLSALMLDIDDFKKFNDQYSYQIGDEVIARLAARPAENVREVDLVDRYGGDEFIILLVGDRPGERKAASPTG